MGLADCPARLQLPQPPKHGLAPCVFNDLVFHWANILKMSPKMAELVGGRENQELCFLVRCYHVRIGMPWEPSVINKGFLDIAHL